MLSLVLSSVEALKEVSVLPEPVVWPDVAVAAVLVDAVDDGLDGVDLVRAHHHELLLARDEDHVFADHLAKRALGEEPIGEVVEVGDLRVVLDRELVDRKEPLVARQRRSAARCCWQSTTCPCGC